MTSTRDEHLGALLDEIPVREHGPGYWDDVLAAVGPELASLRAQAAGAQDGRPVRLGERRPSRSRVWMAAAAAAAIAILAVVLLGGLPIGGEQPAVLGPPPATAAEAIGYALGALDDAQAIEGTLSIGKVRDGVYSAGNEVTFLCSRDGSYRITTKTLSEADALHGLPDYVETMTYDAGTRVAQGVFDYGAQGFRSEVTTEDPDTGQTVTTTTVSRYVFVEQRDVAPGPPDPGLYATSSFPLWQVRAYLRTMLGDPRVRFTTDDLGGRPVWTLRAEAFTRGDPAKAGEGRPVTVVIDADTRLPLRMTGYRGDYEVRMDSVALTEAPDASEFTLDKPPASETQDQTEWVDDEYWHFSGLPYSNPAAMEQAVDGVPAFPAWIPRGFTLRTGAFQTHGSVSLPRSLGGGSIPGTTVSQAFDRGFDTVYVSARPDPMLTHRTMTGLPGDETPHIRTDTSNPYVVDVAPWDRDQWSRHTTDVSLRSGAFEGATAHIIIDPGYWPHLWVKKDGWVATVAGDLTREQMVRIAESLGPWRDWGVE
jgi:hypothetical protein